MATDPRAGGVFETSRMLPFRPEDVYAAFAQADQLAQWWGPDGFTNAFEVFEFRPEGRWTFVMTGPDGQRYPNQNQFVETSPGKIVIRHLSLPHFTLTVSMLQQGGQTRLHWRQILDDPAVATAVAHIIEPSNEQNLNRLHKLLASRAAQ
ncbi:polyketide cyclase [Hydrogenophaga crassostreae]|uniref:Polyketide cyclase n=1 Tax=Hydrogenophaga crassostreae TaxID=1763535 RepID=A0A162SQU4_9BURK|nr:SRPBCC domain-containing protein [Hydrogenophaga crassostreae]AOW15904.1 polyketide cyclase [Hydrogenophaga crassostreae]OAD39572.1 polyketide cyclase [Hydrogenophaga crassostreae]